MKKNLTIYLDMLRCPNTCRHCEREMGGKQHSLSLAEIRIIVERLQFEAKAVDVCLDVCTNLKEPMFHPEFFEIQAYLKDIFPNHNEANPSCATIGLNIARDPEFLGRLFKYNPRLKKIQLTITELEDAHDRFVCRKGAFRDIEIAAERTLAAGLRITWIYILHGGNFKHLEAMSRWVRSKDPNLDTSSELIFLTKSQCRGRNLPRLHQADLESLPAHFREIFVNWGGISCVTEGEIVTNLLEDKLKTPNSYGLVEPIGSNESCNCAAASSLTLELEHNGDYYPFCHEHHPAFLLGNFNHDTLSVILDRYARDAIPALHARRVLGLKELARKHGKRDSNELHNGCSLCRTLVYRHLGI